MGRGWRVGGGSAGVKTDFELRVPRSTPCNILNDTMINVQTIVILNRHHWVWLYNEAEVWAYFVIHATVFMTLG